MSTQQQQQTATSASSSTIKVFDLAWPIQNENPMTLLSKIGNVNVQTHDFNLKQWQSEVQKGQFQYNM
jgi:hypothetical protein